MTARAAAQRSYHHGDLRNALILAAAELIEERGSVEFSMADAARRAGVSNAAPYRHFRDKEALLEAVAGLAFLGLLDTSQETARQHPSGSESAIVALGENYIDFVLRHRAFYDLMWGDAGARFTGNDCSDQRGTSFQVLVDAVGAYCEHNGIQGADVPEIATTLWALVHGFAALALNGLVNRFAEHAEPHRLLRNATAAFLTGLRHPDH